MMRSLYSGVSGLKTHQTKMDVIGNNIANVNTVAFKSSSVTFGELMYQTTSNASSPNADTGRGGINAKQIGLGVQMGATNVSITTTGATQTTGNPFDLKITGDSFFIVNDGQSNYFTRAGAFYVDAVGNLAMTSTGYNVMGWQVGQDGNIIQNTVSPIKILSAEHMFSQPEATEKGTCSGVLDKSDPNLASANGKVLSLSVYDDLGYEYTAKFSIKPLVTADGATQQVTNTTTIYGAIKDIKRTDTTDYSFRLRQGKEDKSGVAIDKYTSPVGTYNGDQITIEGALKIYAEEQGLTSANMICMDYTNTDVSALDVPAGVTVKQSGKDTINRLLQIMSIDSSSAEATKFKYEQSNVGTDEMLFVVKQDISSYSIEDGTSSTPIKNISKDTLEALRKGGVLRWKTVDSSKPATDPVNTNTYEQTPGFDLVRYEKRYYDGTAPSVVYNLVCTTNNSSYGDPSKTASLGDKIDLTDALKEVSSDQMGIFIAPLDDKDFTIFDTYENVSKESFIEGQYTVELSELIDIANGKSTLDVSGLGSTKRTLMYDTNNGKFRYIGTEGQTDYDLHLSALGGKFRDIAIDFSSTKNVSNEGTSTIGIKAGDEDGNGAGKLLGALKGVSVDSNGKIYGSYDNGNTELLGQIAVTEFANASGLEKVGENLYQTTLNSGEFDGIGRDISSLSGSMTTGVLEMSNVDLSAEFTDMITTQRGFQANSRIITTSDTLLEELINLKR